MNPSGYGLFFLLFAFVFPPPAAGQGITDTIPSDFPTFQVLVNDNPAPGFLFLAPVVRTTTPAPWI